MSCIIVNRFPLRIAASPLSLVVFSLQSSPTVFPPFKSQSQALNSSTVLIVSSSSARTTAVRGLAAAASRPAVEDEFADRVVHAEVKARSEGVEVS